MRRNLAGLYRTHSMRRLRIEENDAVNGGVLKDAEVRISEENGWKRVEVADICVEEKKQV